MRTVWKFELHPSETSESEPVAMPHGAQALSVGCQGERLFIWALVDPRDGGYPIEDRVFLIYGTGHKIDRPLGKFVGTAQMQSDYGELVWHVWEKA
jgi:hypothetical protein